MKLKAGAGPWPLFIGEEYGQDRNYQLSLG